MRIVIVGAGIGGLIAAAALASDGHEVVVYEQRARPGAVGAGLTLFGNAFAALDAIGLGDLVRSVSTDAIAQLRGGIRRPSGRWLMSVPGSAVSHLRSLHRADLHEALAGALPPGVLRAGHRAVVDAGGAPVVSVAGKSETADLVIAADGLRSDARSRWGLDRGVRYAGYTAWRGVASSPVDLRGVAGETWGAGARFGIVPLPEDRTYWFATTSVPERTNIADNRAALAATFGAWHPPVGACLDATPPDAILRHDIYDLMRVPGSFVRHRGVLLGDCAHAMTPDLGQGAGQAIEDAATLVIVLRDAVGEAALTTALARYDRLRRKRTSVLWRQSRLAGRVAQASGALTAGARDAALAMVPSSLFERVSARAQHWSPPT